MIETVHPWERILLGLAFEAWHSVVHPPSQPIQDSKLLEESYAHCHSVTALHSRSFHLASALLPAPKRQAARALYAFCRVTDDLVDRSSGDVEANLRGWRQQVSTWHPPADDLVAVAWADTRARYHIPQRYVEQLIEGVGRDLHQSRYDTFEDLTTYCYGVASTVGLMSMHITGFAGPEAIPYAVKLGVALQLTNILRDVGEDWQAGRVYLPQEDLAAFNLSEADLAAGRIDERWRAFMRFQIARTRRLYAEAQPGIALLNPDGRFAIAAAAGLYSAILDDIEAHDFDVFGRRAHVSGWGKLRRLPGIWWQSTGRPWATKSIPLTSLAVVQ
ncbi:MAG: phytoene/squalene synthase family protein [Anaerolineae bacterium]|nr:phytoene/squalene synthase family protein [Anaerolineae bacterium]